MFKGAERSAHAHAPERPEALNFPVAAKAALMSMPLLKELLELLSATKGETVIATARTLLVDEEGRFATESFELVTGNVWLPVTLLDCYDATSTDQRSFLYTTGKGGRTADIAERIGSDNQPAVWTICPAHPFFR